VVVGGHQVPRGAHDRHSHSDLDRCTGIKSSVYFSSTGWGDLSSTLPSHHFLQGHNREHPNNLHLYLVLFLHCYRQEDPSESVRTAQKIIRTSIQELGYEHCLKRASKIIKDLIILSPLIPTMFCSPCWPMRFSDITLVLYLNYKMALALS